MLPDNNIRVVFQCPYGVLVGMVNEDEYAEILEEFWCDYDCSIACNNADGIKSVCGIMSPLPNSSLSVVRSGLFWIFMIRFLYLNMPGRYLRSGFLYLSDNYMIIIICFAIGF